ncbi:MAG: UxaA family hydrolase [Geminicoccaceae bacterium]|nr:UxaA family hydrolase [Geminicoccaceae bacterium]
MKRPAVILLAEADNVLVACRNIEAGEMVPIDGVPTRIEAALPLGFKIARRAIGRGEKVLKLGMSIGSATADIDRGQRVHTENLKSDYTPSFTADHGDRFRQGETL